MQRKIVPLPHHWIGNNIYSMYTQITQNFNVKWYLYTNGIVHTQRRIERKIYMHKYNSVTNYSKIVM